MTSERLVEFLAERFGKERVRVNSEFHVQVLNGTAKPHDIWITKHREIKWKLSGSRDIRTRGFPGKLLNDIEGYNPKATHLAEMKSAVELCNFIGIVTHIAEQQKIRRAIFVDAGLKDNRARIGLVILDGDDVFAERGGHSSIKYRRCGNASYTESFSLGRRYVERL
jgi:hypothetical protein